MTDEAPTKREKPWAKGLPKPDYRRHPTFQPLFDQVTPDIQDEALSLFLPAFQERFVFQGRLPQRNFKARMAGDDHVLRGLQADGVVLTQLTPQARARLRELSGPIVREIDARLDTLPKPQIRDAQLQVEAHAQAELWGAVDAALEEIGLYEIGAAYAGGPVKLGAVAVQVNKGWETRQKWGVIEEDGLPFNKTSYFHIDSVSWPSLKALIYLNDVGPEDGPFRYVVGSHRWKGDFEAAVRKTNDKVKLSWLQFVALPEPFRQSTIFGDYLEPDSPGARLLLQHERVVCDGRSDVVLFDNHGVHRGGFVRSGWRAILQCSFGRVRV